MKKIENIISKEDLKEKVNVLAKGLGEKSTKVVNTVGTKSVDLAKKTAKVSTDLAVKTKGSVINSKEIVMNKMDVNNDGHVDIEDIIIIGMRTPGIKINREEFLRKELSKKYSKETIDTAVKSNPNEAGISLNDIDKLVDETIKYERNCVSGISAALGMPGGVTMVATLPADITQYYGYMLRAAQKLLYLYGFPEINTEDTDSSFDTETINILILCLGVMYGTAGANNAIKAMAKALASGVEKQLMRKALTKGTIYPIVKSVSKWFGVKMTKDVFAGFFKKSIPVVGGVIGGGLTYLSFKPCCVKLKDSLRDTLLSNPSYIDNSIVNIIADGIVSEDEISEDQLEKIVNDNLN